MPLRLVEKSISRRLSGERTSKSTAETSLPRDADRPHFPIHFRSTFESSAALLSSHPEALSFGNKLGGSTNNVPSNSAAADGQRAANGRSANASMVASREASPMPSDMDGVSVT